MSNTNALAQNIQRRLREAQAAPATTAAPQATPESGSQQLRVTKGGDLLAPGEPNPTDGTPVQAIPTATFHRGCGR
jgi:hypothetical protein